MVEALLNSKAMRLVINLEFVKKKLKKIENSIYVRNVNRILNKEGPIKNTIEVNIYY